MTVMSNVLLLTLFNFEVGTLCATLSNANALLTLPPLLRLSLGNGASRQRHALDGQHQQRLERQGLLHFKSERGGAQRGQMLFGL